MWKFGTWNVRSMCLGKLEVIKREMLRLHIDILGVSEINWIGNGFFYSDDFTVFYSGNDTIRRKGVAFIASKKIARCVESFRNISDRIITIRISGKPRNTTIMQVYAPTTDASDEEIENFYFELQKTLDDTPKQDIVIIIGDFNAKVGDEPEADITGRFGLGDRNDAGTRLIQFCQEHHFKIMNTWFRQPKRRLYTWTSPNELYRNQIDFVLCSKKWASSMENPVLRLNEELHWDGLQCWV